MCVNNLRNVNKHKLITMHTFQSIISVFLLRFHYAKQFSAQKYANQTQRYGYAI